MKVLVIHGSPHEGQTLKLIERFKTAIAQNGEVKFDHINVHDLDLKLCRGCFTCVTRGEQFCPLKNDDVKLVVEKMDQTDAAIIAAPTYMYSIPAGMKNLIDRLSYLGHRPKYLNKYAVVISTTCEKGLKNALKYLSLGTAWAWGFKLIGTLGAETHPFFLDKDRYEKLGKRIQRLAHKFFNAVNNEKAILVNFEEMMRFRAMLKHSMYSKDIFPADFAFYNHCNNENDGYFVKEYKINYFVNMASNVLSFFVGRYMKKCRDKTNMKKVFLD